MLLDYLLCYVHLLIYDEHIWVFILFVYISDMEFEIVCIVKNRQGIIHNVGTSDGHRYTIDELSV